MLQVKERGGLYLPDCGLWMDARRAKPFAVVTHAHSDHTARHHSFVATAATLDFMRVVSARRSPGAVSRSPMGRSMRMGQ
jgi:Cft2 family RNA processing exonuclease